MAHSRENVRHISYSESNSKLNLDYVTHYYTFEITDEMRLDKLVMAEDFIKFGEGMKKNVLETREETRLGNCIPYTDEDLVDWSMNNNKTVEQLEEKYNEFFPKHDENQFTGLLNKIHSDIKEIKIPGPVYRKKIDYDKISDGIRDILTKDRHSDGDFSIDTLRRMILDVFMDNDCQYENKCVQPDYKLLDKIDQLNTPSDHRRETILREERARVQAIVREMLYK